MFVNLLRFELRTWLRGTMVYVFVGVVALMVFGAVSSDRIVVGQALENTHRNAPYVIQNFYAVMSVLTLLMTTAFFNSAASRDFALNTYQLLFTTPLRKRDYLLARFFGSSLIAVMPMLGISLAIIIARYMPWVDAERWGDINWLAHLRGITVFAIPNTLFIAAIIFAIAVLTRSTITSFLGALVLLVAYVVSDTFLEDIDNEQIAMLLDPFAARTFSLMTKYWTVAERNTLSLGYEGMLLLNRLIWLAAGAAIFAFAYQRFAFAERRRKGKAAVPETRTEVHAVPVPGGAAGPLAQLLGATKVEFWGLVKQVSFIVILVAALLNMVPQLIFNSTESFGVSSFPVTYLVLEMIAGSLYLFSIAIITYFAGVLVWKERDAHIDDIFDALPHPTWIAYASKFVTLMLVLAIIQALAMLTGILVQTFKGYTRYQFSLYFADLFVADYSLFFFFAVLAFFIHVLSPNKYIGYFVYVTFLIANGFVWGALDVSSRLGKYASRPPKTYSDFFGYAPYLSGWIWFTLYWCLVAALLMIASLGYWQRGRETSWRHRFRQARTRLTGASRALVISGVLGYLITLGWVYYNTKILNSYVTEDDSLDRRADYEKLYKKHERSPQPRITSVRYDIDLFPESRALILKASQVIRNKSTAPVADLYITYDSDFSLDLAIEGATLAREDRRLNFRTYRLQPPMRPGEERQMRYTLGYHAKGFENAVRVIQIVQNGSFFNSGITPQIGYQPRVELDNRNDRRKRDLKERDTMPALERDCVGHCMDTYLSNNSDWVDVETVISTSPDQIAVAPGSLQREWRQSGRRYFSYKLDHPSLNFYSFISARYQVARESWNGIDIEVYHHPEHAWNVPKMLKSVRKSLEYFTTHFGPYRHRQARIIEFPRVASFAQAFPGTMPYSESIGFIANLTDPDDIDKVYYVVAHEMAHQWWAHQVIGANMQGGTLLSETLAQYSALMVMEHEYGRDQMRKFLEYEMDGYLRSRGRELLKERSLLQVESGQGYIHYRKGSVVMYAVKEMIGEAAVNRALRKLVERYGYQEPPYPTSYALLDALREETPVSMQPQLQDLFEHITLNSNRTLAATAKKRADGKYDVEISVEARKFRADVLGLEREVPVNGLIEVGAFAAPAKGKKYGKTLHREAVPFQTGQSAVHFVVDELPEKAGIDPFHLLIDRVPNDNLKKVTLN
jgi:ABC-2 type transport system permease protein